MSESTATERERRENDPIHLGSFRDETRAWLEANCPSGVRNLPAGEDNTVWGGRNVAFKNEDQRVWLERMAAKGWTVPEWPREYGGGGLSQDEAKILAEEMKRIGAHPALSSLGIWMLGPALLKFGTHDQKREHLPKIARGEIRWAQGYSEPGAGSDLASVQMRGVDMGDHFLINGSKIWTSYGDKCDMIFALVRTEPDAPKHQGISFLLIDMADPGVSTRPIRLISGESTFTQTFFDNVKALKQDLVGERGGGWNVCQYLLSFERAMMAAPPTSNRAPETVAERAARVLGSSALTKTGALRADILQYEMDSWIMRIALERNRDLAKAKELPPTAASALKLFGTELTKKRAELLMAVDGAAAFDTHAVASNDWLWAPVLTIAGGSSEIQLNVIAKRALGLPGA
jgi:acyl-CoA dehydrogenase